jgi:hypothetical protein
MFYCGGSKLIVNSEAARQGVLKRKKNILAVSQ